MTIIEKFEAKASTDFAIILLTGDDKGNQKDQNSLNLRARQNVIFEMGYFFALLGRKNVVCLQEEEIEVPSDLGGHMYIKLDKSNNWKLKLIQELKHAGFDVTADKI
jgi:predicted nucleotide-binding protein